MSNATKQDLLPPLVADLLSDPVPFIDNVFADGWKRLSVNTLIAKAGLTKRTGTGVSVAVYLLLIWRWLNVSSISMFSQKALGLFSQAKKDVTYDLLKREDINWRALNLSTAGQLYSTHKLQSNEDRAFLLDDPIKTRKGKRMEGVSSHFDQVSNTSVMGQQVLTLGLSTDQAFVSLDSQIAISNVRTQGLAKDFKDGRSAGAQRYNEAVGQTRVKMATGMIRRAVRHGIRASYVVADAWFGNKDMMRAAMQLGMVAILRMKRNKTKYRVPHGNGYTLLDANELYRRAVRKQWVQVADLPCKAVEMVVEIDLSTAKGRHATPSYQPVKLLFVRGINDKEDRTASRKDWALFLSTDASISSAKTLQVYALRWSIEVYFREAKQHLGIL
ncbi:MAG: transposase [Granulosicoccus sp.]